MLPLLVMCVVLAFVVAAPVQQERDGPRRVGDFDGRHGIDEHSRHGPRDTDEHRPGIVDHPEGIPLDDGEKLRKAAHNGDLQKMKTLIFQNKVDVNSQAPHGNTALFLAAGMGETEAMELLLEHGADPNLANEDGGTALHLAAGAGNWEEAKLLIDAGADVQAQDTDHGMTVLMAACGAAEPRIVRLLLDLGASIHPKDVHGDTALTWILHDGHRDPDHMNIREMFNQERERQGIRHPKVNKKKFGDFHPKHPLHNELNRHYHYSSEKKRAERLRAEKAAGKVRRVVDPNHPLGPLESMRVEFEHGVNARNEL